jgi:hypothetical protein
MIGNPLKPHYYWSASDGFLGLGFSNSITWTAPSTPGTYKIKVVVNDHKGGWGEGTITEISNGHFGQAIR